MANYSLLTDGNSFGGLTLVPPTTSREAITRACIKCWFESNASGNHNWADCSGFVKAVQQELRLEPFKGRASSIADEVYIRPDWRVIGVGSAAAIGTQSAVNAGRLVIAAWKHPSGGTGHVAIITMHNSFAGHKVEQQLAGAWGTLNSVGSLFNSISKSFGANKHPDIVYAACNSVIFGV